MYASIGKCSITTAEVTCNQAILGIQTKKIDTEFLYQYLTFSQKKLSQMAQTGTQDNLNKHIVQNLDIPDPPDPEKEKINEILFNLDEQIKQLEDTKNKYVMIKEGIMQKLLTGEIRLA